MIVAGYAGVGKSMFARATAAISIDLHSMPYRRILPNERDEGESIKAAPYLLANPAFPYNYIAAILEAESKYEYVLIPPIGSVLSQIYRDYQIPYLLCYPSIELKEEYRQRFLSRGNTADFTDVFIAQWDERIQMLEGDTCGIHFRLGPGQFLTDIQSEMEHVIHNLNRSGIKATRSKGILELQKIADVILSQSCLTFWDEPTCWYYPLDLRIAENRDWIYDLGKICYENEILVTADEIQELETFFDHMYAEDQDSKLHQLGSRQEVLRLIEKNSQTVMPMPGQKA